MSWKQLLEQRKIQLPRTSNEELDKLRALIARDLNDSGLTALSADRRFATAYNAALQTTKVVIACAGYRVSSIPGQEDAAIRASELKGAPLESLKSKTCCR
jgi:hypothetical protein